MLKRSFDILFSLICVIILSPVYLIVAFLIKLESKGPVLFIQERVGKDEKLFRIFKFRSMIVHAYAPEELGPVKHNHAVVTKVGYVLRRTKLDEIPQFFNVLFGQMSVVGPRPCLFESVKNMPLVERRRFRVLPGITGWAEVNGNVELTWSEQLALDLWYVDHQSFSLDIFILIKTLQTVMMGSIRNTTALAQAQQYKSFLQGGKE